MGPYTFMERGRMMRRVDKGIMVWRRKEKQTHDSNQQPSTNQFSDKDKRR